MISVSEALNHLFDLVTPMGSETVPLRQAAGRVLAEKAVATRAQPPFDASAMDGYAVANATKGARLRVMGESAAGHGFDGAVGPGQAVRIFTGALVPAGATHIVLQEDVTREGDWIVVEDIGATHIRPAGGDFSIGEGVPAGRVASPYDVALMAAMNVPVVRVAKRPHVAVISTGDELVMPGEVPRDDQIVASNTFGLTALLDAAGADVRMLPIARDTASSLRHAFLLASEVDLILTIGGASVGDHDLVADVAQSHGLTRAFHKVAMRPGKPLMSGRMGQTMMIGLPGNPVSALVCGHIFVLPVIKAMLGLGAHPAARKHGRLATPLPKNGPREHYMRAALQGDGLAVFERQDSSLLSLLSKADALVVHPPHAAALPIGTDVTFVPL